MTTQIEPQKREVLQLVERMQKSWNERNAKAYAESFAEDAEFTTVFGNVNRGRKTIEEGHMLVFAKLFKNSSLFITGTSVRFIKPDVVSLHLRWEMKGATQPDGTPWKERKGLMTWIVVYQNRRWEIVVAHNSELVDPLPGLGPLLENKS
jgi:uncharacterized protein (TIGR02246 family)